MLTEAFACNALKFGNFVLKSGRNSPYFFNMGQMMNGQGLAAIGHYYVDCIDSAINKGILSSVDVLFGPAYKGIPIASVVGPYLYEESTHDFKKIEVAFNRKEAKDHGEGGTIVGNTMVGKKVLILDDVITAGTAIRESYNTITSAGGKVVGVVVGLDRQEIGNDTNESAVQQVSSEFGIPVLSVHTFEDVVSYARKIGMNSEFMDKMEAYRNLYGVKENYSLETA